MTFFLVLFGAAAAHAEYRVFSLVINDNQTGRSRTVISTLDDIQYPSYHPLKRSETIVIEDSWMCWRRTDYFQSPCPNPRAATTEGATPLAPL